MVGTRQRTIAASLYAAIILLVTALPFGLLLTAPNFVLVLSLFVLMWTPAVTKLRLRVLIVSTGAVALASILGSSALLWWLGGGVDDLAALLLGPAVYISTAVASIAFAAATTYPRRVKLRQVRSA